MRALHLGPLHELLGRKDRLHLLGLLRPRLAHRLAMGLHRLQLLERRGIDLFGLFFRELQAFGHAVRHLAGHLLDGGAFARFRTPFHTLRLREGARTCRHAEGGEGCKNRLSHLFRILVKHSRLSKTVPGNRRYKGNAKHENPERTPGVTAKGRAEPPIRQGEPPAARS